MATGTFRRILPRIAIALGSFVVTFFLLEGVARLFGPPVLFRDADDVYSSRLPLVNGRSNDSWTDEFLGREGEEPSGRSDGDELRVATFGESSMEGTPWGHAASPANQLRDYLASALPGTRVTVLNMGRASSFAMDAYYYLAAIIRFRPDVVFFYSGMNERYDLDREACLPVTHPAAYRVWRWLVERSRLLWVARVHLPRFVQRPGVSGVRSEVLSVPLCDSVAGFHAWTDILVSTAQSTGAQVFVASLITNEYARLDYRFQDEHSGDAPARVLPRLRGAHRDLVACALEPDCDLSRLPLSDDEPGTLRRLAESVGRVLAPDWVLSHIEARNLAWKRTAEARGAVFVDFASVLRGLSPGGRLGPPHIVDECHLTVEGYGLLARMVGDRILDWRLGRPASTGGAYVFPDVAKYNAVAFLDTTNLALVYARGKRFLGAAFLAKGPAAAGSRNAQLLQGWMRRGLGLWTGLSPDLEAGLDAFADEFLSSGR